MVEATIGAQTSWVLMQTSFKALSVHNPWGWALVTKRPGGGPLKPVENRTTPLGAKNVGTWVLIHVGHSHRPEMSRRLRYQLEQIGVEPPEWATTRFKKRGAIVGAVLFEADVTPQEAEKDPYARLWVTPQTGTPDRRRCWMVKDCVAFGHHIPSKGTQAPLIWTPSPDVHAEAAAEMGKLVDGLSTR